MRFILILLCFLMGCTTAQTELVDKNDVFTISKKVLGKNHYVIVLPKDNVLSGDLEELTQTIAGYFSDSDTRAAKYSIASFSPEVTAKVIKDALAMHGGKKLSRLTILYFGEKQYEKEVKAAVHAVGGKFYFHERKHKQDQDSKAK